MPTQKDLKRLVRTRMKKTGEAYTAARFQLLKKKTEPAPGAGYAELAGMSDAAVQKATGRNWAQWVILLDRSGAKEKPHREIASHVSSLGTPDWWTQMVTVGYERIRGLRDRSQRRGGTYEASKSRTFQVGVKRLFDAFAKPGTRRRWLPAGITVRSQTPPKRMRMSWEAGTVVLLEFTSKGAAKSSVAISHQKLADRSAVQAAKQAWSERFDRLGELLS